MNSPNLKELKSTSAYTYEHWVLGMSALWHNELQ